MDSILFYLVSENKWLYDGYKGNIAVLPTAGDIVIMESGTFEVVYRRFNFKTKTVTIFVKSV